MTNHNSLTIALDNVLILCDGPVLRRRNGSVHCHCQARREVVLMQREEEMVIHFLFERDANFEPLCSLMRWIDVVRKKQRLDVGDEPRLPG